MWLKMNRRGMRLLTAAACLVMASEAEAQTNYQRLVSLGPASITGSKIVAEPIEGSDGALYAVTSSDGAYGGGTVFRLNKDGSGLSVLWNLPSGSFANGRLLEGSDGALYGTTEFGGSNNVGTIFKLNRNGSNFSILHSFNTNSGDGGLPLAGLLKGADGALYGTTSVGGSSNLGTIFRLKESGSDYTVLYSFAGTNGMDGSKPYAGVMQASNGVLYGSTQEGGSNDIGIVYRITTNGTDYIVLHQFGGLTNNDGNTPLGGLVEGDDGLLYGTTAFGGTLNQGTMFKLDKTGATFAIVHNFLGSPDGSYPFITLLKGIDGAFYGTTTGGGTQGVGTAFRFNPSNGSYSTLHNFGSMTGDGSFPWAALTEGSDGALYGATISGGDAGKGTLYRLFSGAARVRISTIQRTGNGILLHLAGGSAGQSYDIQATTNLVNAGSWVAIGSTNAAIDGTFQFLDGGSTNYPSRYYRSARP